MNINRMNLVDGLEPWTQLMTEELEEAATYACRDGLDRDAFLAAAGKAYDASSKPLDPFLSGYFRFRATNAVPPDTVLVVSGPLYDERGNIRPQTLITGFSSAQEAEEN